MKKVREKRSDMQDEHADLVKKYNTLLDQWRANEEQRNRLREEFVALEQERKRLPGELDKGGKERVLHRKGNPQPGLKLPSEHRDPAPRPPILRRPDGVMVLLVPGRLDMPAFPEGYEFLLNLNSAGVAEVAHAHPGRLRAISASASSCRVQEKIRWSC